MAYTITLKKSATQPYMIKPSLLDLIASRDITSTAIRTNSDTGSINFFTDILYRFFRRKVNTQPKFVLHNLCRLTNLGWVVKGVRGYEGGLRFHIYTLF